MCSRIRRSKSPCSAAHRARDPSSHSGVRVVGSSMTAFRARSSTTVASLSFEPFRIGSIRLFEFGRDGLPSAGEALGSAVLCWRQIVDPISNPAVGLNESPVIDAHRPKDLIADQDQDGKHSHSHALHDDEPVLRTADQNNDGTDCPRGDRSPATQHVEHQGEETDDGRCRQRDRGCGTEVSDSGPSVAGRAEGAPRTNWANSSRAGSSRWGRTARTVT